MTAPADSTAERLLVAIQTRLAGIEAGTSYFFTPSEVTRDWVGFHEAKGYPTYCVIEGQREPYELEQLTMGTCGSRLGLYIVGLISDDTARRTTLNRCIADVCRALFTDQTFGGLALWLRQPTIKTDEAALFAKPFAYFELTTAAYYVHAPGDV